jgi:hypothetical protein
MAVAIISNFGPGTPETYDKLAAEMGTDTEPPTGLIFHWAGEVDGNWTITDVWESAEDNDRFLQERLMPAMQKLGDQIETTQPQIAQAQIHNYIGP